MATAKNATTNEVDQYIAGFPKPVQDLLQKVRATVKKAAPDAMEVINYGIPTLQLQGNLVHFAGYKNHIGFYPAPSGIEAFKKELSVYEGAKGSVKFPIDQPIPYDLITKITAFRVRENLEKAATKKSKPAKDDFLSQLAAPAKRALEANKIKTLQQLSRFSQADIAALHGMGPNAVKKLTSALAAKGLSFKK